MKEQFISIKDIREIFLNYMFSEDYKKAISEFSSEEVQHGFLSGVLLAYALIMKNCDRYEQEE